MSVIICGFCSCSFLEIPLSCSNRCHSLGRPCRGNTISRNFEKEGLMRRSTVDASRHDSPESCTLRITAPIYMKTKMRKCKELLTVNCPVSLSYPTCIICTGFSGAEILMFRGEPSILLTKDENPLFFRSGPGALLPLKPVGSSEYRLGLVVPSDRGGVISIGFSAGKL